MSATRQSATVNNYRMRWFLYVSVGLAVIVLVAGIGCSDSSPTAPEEDAENQQAGLGISRKAMQKAIPKEANIDWQSPLELGDGRTNVIGTAASTNVNVELIGPKDNLTNVSVIFGHVDSLTTALNFKLFEIVILEVLPDWTDSRDWLKGALDTIVAQNKHEVFANVDGITVKVWRKDNSFVLAITADE